MNLSLPPCGLLLALGFAGIAVAQEAPPEPPYALDPVEVTAEKRAELAFRTVQIALERPRSDRAEDADQIVCLKQVPTGSHVTVINCATNRFWSRVRAASLSNGLAGFQQTSGPTGSDSMMMATGSFLQSGGLEDVGVSRVAGPIKREDEKIVTLSLNDYNKLKKRFGELPPQLRAAAAAKPD